MRSAAPLVLACALGVSQSLSLPARQQAPGVPPLFRTGIDLIEIDVSVLDRARRPVNGLTADDFTVFVDDEPRPLVAFKAIELPRTPPPPPADVASWVTDLPSDVETNTAAVGRVVVILIDDFGAIDAKIGLQGVRRMRDTAHRVIDQLGPEDRAAVLFTANAHTAQTFTSNRQLLAQAVDNAQILGSGPEPICWCRTCPIAALRNVADVLRDIPEQRKLVVYISAGSVVMIPRQRGLPPQRDFTCNLERRHDMRQALAALQAANATVLSIDPKGLETGATMDRDRPELPHEYSMLEDPVTRRVEFLRTMAESTGGRAIVNINEAAEHVPALLDETSSYYLLAVERPARQEDGRFHPIRVRVRRGDVEVRTRNGYYDTTRRVREAVSRMNVSGNAAVATLGVLPRRDLPLDVAVAPFAAGDKGAALAVVLRAHPPSPARLDGTVNVRAALYHPERGHEVTAHSHRLDLTWAPGASTGDFEVLSRLDAPPGRYELRVGLLGSDGRTASVYTSVEVPAFDNEDLSLSGLVLAAEPAGLVESQDAFAGVLPVRPTARRSFRSTDAVTAFARVYQKSAMFEPSIVTASVTNTAGVVLGRDTQTVAGGAATRGSAGDFRTELPLHLLPAGEYLLTVSAAAASHSAERRLRFHVEAVSP